MKTQILTLGLVLCSATSFGNDDSVIISNAYIPFVAERVQTETGGFTRWSDGYIEQWGQKAKGDDEVVFHLPFTKVNTISFVIQEYSPHDQYGRHPKYLPTETGVYDFYRSDMVGTWIAKGF